MSLSSLSGICDTTPVHGGTRFNDRNAAREGLGALSLLRLVELFDLSLAQLLIDLKGEGRGKEAQQEKKMCFR